LSPPPLCFLETLFEDFLRDVDFLTDFLGLSDFLRVARFLFVYLKNENENYIMSRTFIRIGREFLNSSHIIRADVSKNITGSWSVNFHLNEYGGHCIIGSGNIDKQVYKWKFDTEEQATKFLNDTLTPFTNTK